MKTCRTCQQEKPIGEFYPNSRMADGRLNHCRDCVKKRIAANRRQKAEHYNAYALDRSKTPDGRKKHLARVRAARANPTAPDACQRCHRRGVELDRHHPNYDEPDRIEWLCADLCHPIADRERETRELQEVP